MNRVMFHFTGLSSDDRPDATFNSTSVWSHLFDEHQWMNGAGGVDAIEVLRIHHELHQLEFLLYPTWTPVKKL